MRLRTPLFPVSGSALGLLLLLVSACDSSSPPVPTTMSAVGGASQTATVGTTVPTAPAVKILDEKGEPISGLTVTFAVTSGGGSLAGASGTTDNTGVARAGPWTLGTTAGENTVTASAQGLTPVTFTATGTADTPTSIAANSSDSQSGVVGAAVGTPPSVLLQDQYGNPVPQASVTFQVTGGGGSLSGDSATTNTSGIATVGAWTLGTTPGVNTLEASYSGLSAVSFSATAEADSPDAVTVTSGDGQTATVGTQVATLPTVEVADHYGNRLEGVTVTFAVASGGGTITGASQTTNTNGRATLESWTLGTTAGTQTVTATVEGVDPAIITATAEADNPTTTLAASGDNQTATVGNDVSLTPTVKVEDQYGNGVPGIQVAFVETGSPSPERSDGAGRVVTGGNTTTDSNGEASPESWILGTTAGTYQLTATVQGLSTPVVFTATAEADVPSVVEKTQGDNQTVQFGTAVPVNPTVKVTDQYGNPLAGVSVTFTETAGGGSATGGSQTTAADGTAAVGSWTLGPAPGNNTLTAEADGVGSVVFTASGTALAPANLTKTAGDNQTATVGTAVAVAPQVQVTTSGGTPVPGALVTFEVASGGGTASLIASSVATTDANGLASVGSWTLGTTAGTNTLTAEVTGVPTVTFTATGTAGPAANMTKRAGDGQSATVSTAVSVPPSVQVSDVFGNGVPGVTVTFAVTDGGGSVTGGTTTSNSNGVATVGGWTLGPIEGYNELTVSSTGLGSVMFTATGTAVPAGGGFSITIVYDTNNEPSASQKVIFRQAADRWEQIITGDLPDVTANFGSCHEMPGFSGTVDDLRIWASTPPIDGTGNILGQAGPCHIRGGPEFPITGLMRFDAADIDALEAGGSLFEVIVHEMGHVLGFGTLWDRVNVNPASWDLLQDAGTADPYFNGANAIAAFDAAGGSGRTAGPKVPVENTGGSGTVDSHWRETVFLSELMTGWINTGSPNPLSAITIASLQDMGYQVNMAAADAYSVFNAQGTLRIDEGERIFLKELPPPTPIVLDKHGNVIRRE